MNTTSAKDRYVLCRPGGGLNDTLCQIEACWKYAERFNRTLVVDFQGRLLMSAVFSKLDPVATGVPVIFQPEPHLLASLDTMTARPAQLSGRLNNYAPEPSSDGAYVDSATGVELGFDLSADHPEQVLVHHREGGGTASYDAISRFTLKTDAAIKVSQSLPALPKNYVAAHIRATDYTSDIDGFFRRLRKRRITAPLVVCSDNDDVLVQAKGANLAKRIITFEPQSAHPGEPLHAQGRFSNSQSADLAAIRLLSEMFVLSQASTVYITFLTLTHRRSRPLLSGFSSLVAFLVKKRHEIPLWNEMPSNLISAQDRGEVVILSDKTQDIAYRWNLLRISSRKWLKRKVRRAKRLVTQLRSRA